MFHAKETDLSFMYRFFEMIKKILHNWTHTIQTQPQK